ncbi:MAG TPA: tetratricopeptide repeat protein [Chitinivibrionales bacterium]|nr:tetratricopeptide repeat protein [Chitinivibrionales bacterium]
MSTSSKYLLVVGSFLLAAVLTIGVIYYRTSIADGKQVAQPTGIVMEYPFHGTMFPPDIAAPTFKWEDTRPTADKWNITVRFKDNPDTLHFTSSKKKWIPSGDVWEKIKLNSLGKTAVFEIRGVSGARPKKVLSGGQVTFQTSPDSVVAPIFYREVNLPFMEAVKDPTNIRWRFGSISSDEQPRIVLQKLPVCGNCHSFSRDAKVMGMEADCGNDKGAYAIMPVKQDIVLDRSKIISWSFYKMPGEDKEPTFGLNNQVSPDGRYVAGTVKDQAIAVYRPNLMFSQLFFFVKGMVSIYDRQTKAMYVLPGASDRRYAQTNATWSPDGKYLVFVRCKSYNLDIFNRQRRALIQGPEAEQFIETEGKNIKYDLCRVAFNNGKGGTPEPLKGASNNGMSNYFAKYSPNGKWIAFCRANNFIFLQPDSKLYIMPAEGGEARELSCNMSILNSWHSWSPNSKWLVFSSKVNGPYTQLFLTHISDSGTSSPPVVLDRFTSVDRAANIPEFVNGPSDAILKIRENYLDAYSYHRIAEAFHLAGDFEHAIPAWRNAIKYNPRNYFAHNNLGALLYQKGLKDDAAEEFKAAINLHIDDEDHYEAHTNYGKYLLEKGEIDKAIAELSIAYKLHPDSITKKNLETVRSNKKTIAKQEALQYND